jgi:hypothetical protein
MSAREERRPENAASELRHRRHVGDIGGARAGHLLEEPCHTLLRPVDDGHHDVRRVIASKLHDPLAQIRFDDVNAGSFEVLVELDFLADHRLRLDRAAYALRSRESRDVATGIVGRLGVEGMSATGFDRRRELVEVVVESRERVRADLARVVTPAVRVGQPIEPGAARIAHAIGDASERASQRLVGQRVVAPPIEGG